MGLYGQVTITLKTAIYKHIDLVLSSKLPGC